MQNRRSRTRIRPGAPQADDITVLTIARAPAARPAMA